MYNYAVSVPWRKVRQNEEVLLAWEMNGKPLPKIHGYPLRVVVTGYIGARSAKWVYKINALAEPSMGPVQAAEYLYYNQQVVWHSSTARSRSHCHGSTRLVNTMSRCRTGSQFKICRSRTFHTILDDESALTHPRMQERHHLPS